MSDDEYLREIVQDELDSVLGDPEILDDIVLDDMSESEIESDFMKRVYKRLLDEFPDYESEHGPNKALGWTIAKRRWVRESVKNFRDDRLMRGAIAAASKSLFNANAKRTELDPKPGLAKRQQHFQDVPWNSALGVFVHYYF